MINLPPPILLKKYIWIAFLLILALGLYLRFYHIQYIASFGWDQGRDAWVIRDILHGQFPLQGPRTGVGHMHIGPAYYYLLAPFFYLFNLDPMASNYFNIICVIINLFLIFISTKTIYNNNAALFATFVYAVSHQMITINQVPWNVTLMPGIAALIFLSIFQVYKKKYKWIFLLWILNGFYWNLHFTALFLPVITILSLVFVKDKMKTLKYSLFSIPLYLMWFVPNILDMLHNNSDANLLNDFFKYYYLGFHLQFLLHRLPDAFIQFSNIFYGIPLPSPNLILPALFTLVILFEKNKEKRLQGYLVLLWFIIPLLGFTLYGGPISDYYFIYTVPMVLYILIYLQQKLLRINMLPFLLLLTLFWGFYTYQNTRDLWIKPTSGGLVAKKENVKNLIHHKKKLQYEEGNIESYLYTIWVVDRAKIQ